MKKIIAVLCAASLVAAACVTTFAGEVEPATETTTVENQSPINPIRPYWPPVPGGNQGGNQGGQDDAQDDQSSQGGQTTQNNQTSNQQQTTPPANGGSRFEDFKESNFPNIPEANKEKIKKVLDLFKDGQPHTFAEILNILVGDSAPAALSAKPSGKSVNVADLEVISKLLEIADSKGNPASHAKVTISAPGNELTKGAAAGTLFVFTADISKDPIAVGLYDASVDASNVVTATLDDAFGCALLVKSN